MFKFFNSNYWQLKTDIGQHLTIDNQVISDLVNAGEISKNDLVIEIGVGTGISTEGLCQKAKKVIAY